MAGGNNAAVQHWNLGIGPITCHAWNKDRTQVAVSGGSDDVAIHIFEWKNGEWKEHHLLTAHHLPVTALDWAPNTNRLVSCSQDKDAFVWTYDEGTKAWKPELVILRCDRAATCVRWSPQENKFAVGSGAKSVSVCYYEKENTWWVSRHIKKPIRSTVTCIDWHPGNILLAVGACDFRARVFSAWLNEIEPKPAPCPWGSKLPFGQLLADVPTNGWVHSIAFSPSGCRLAYSSHDSTIAVIDANVSIEESRKTRTSLLPFKSIRFVSENSVVAAGHDCSPVLFTLTAKSQPLQLVGKLDIPPEQNATTNSAFNMFRNIDRNASATQLNVQLKTLHQNMITEIVPHSGSPENILKFTTCSTDGLLALWDLKKHAEFAR